MSRSRARAGSRSGRRRVERISVREMLGVLVTEWLGRRWHLRLLALTIGAAVFMLHVSTALTPSMLNDWLGSDRRDLIYHVSMLSLFTFSYRLSFAAPPKRGRSTVARPSAPAADLAALVLCSGWGAVCELLQMYIPARHFDYAELAVNALTPVVVLALIVLGRNWRAVLNW